MQRIFYWPTVILLSAIAAGMVNFVFPGATGRPIIIMWFLFVCPGMMIVRLFRLGEPVTEWTLAIALSLSIDASIAGIQLYSGLWSPSATLAIIISFCLLGTIIQITLFLLKPQQMSS